MASPVSPTSAAPPLWRKRTLACGRRSKACLARPDPASEVRASACPPDRPKLWARHGSSNSACRAKPASVLGAPLRAAAPAQPPRGAVRASALRADRREPRLPPERLLRSELFPRPREHRARLDPRVARGLPCPPRNHLPFRRVRPCLVRIAESGLGPKPSASVSALSRARTARRQASTGGYRR